MTQAGRAVERVSLHAGHTVRFRIRVTNLGMAPARDVRRLRPAPADAQARPGDGAIVYRNGRPCVMVPILTGQRQGS